MIWLYRLLFLPVFLITLPFYLIRMWRRGGYGKSFQHRFGLIARLPPVPQGKLRIWLQAVSVGEILAVGPLIRILAQNPAIEIVLTTTTSTGYAEARKRYAENTRAIGIFPLDFWFFSRSAWRRIQPDAILLTESELWPEHLHRAEKQKTPAFLINGRFSDRSFRRYQSYPRLAARLLRKFTRIYAASDLDGSRFRALGCSSSQISQTGSIKFDVAVGARLSEETRSQLRNTLGFYPTTEQQAPFVVVGASTWPGEEATLLTAQLYLKEHGIDCRLLLIPRHAERGASIAQVLEKQALNWCQRSKNETPERGIQIYLADTTGEMAYLMQAGDCAFIGKSLPPNDGGQTPIEAAGLGLPILMGPKMTNFRNVAESLTACGAARTIQDAETLKEALLELHQDKRALDAMQRSGLQWHSNSRGSSQRIADDLQQRLLG
jgi:3-deoxy-D-manno-octulosonic-acid transferase